MPYELEGNLDEIRIVLKVGFGKIIGGENRRRGT